MSTLHAHKKSCQLRQRIISYNNYSNELSETPQALKQYNIRNQSWAADTRTGELSTVKRIPLRPFPWTSRMSHINNLSTAWIYRSHSLAMRMATCIAECQTLHANDLMRRNTISKAEIEPRYCSYIFVSAVCTFCLQTRCNTKRPRDCYDQTPGRMPSPSASPPPTGDEIIPPQLPTELSGWFRV